ncbi:DUF465 domain-containing protein [Kordiimonas sp. SCSIO 12603]|nr:DUF465 domain-containing protein [Kordiimonas sp. SCSIO 12603]
MDEDAIREHLTEVIEQHRDLDDAITAMGAAGSFDALQLQRMKKRKLALKDEIEKFQSMLVPDIIA